MEATQGLVRALELARSVTDSDLIDQTATRMAGVVREEIAVDEHRPGIPFTLLESLISLQANHRPEAIEELIDLVEEK